MKLRVGFLGFAHGHQFGLVSQIDPQYAKIGAIADEEPCRLNGALERLSGRLSNVKVYEDYYDLIRDENIDLVSICVENDKKTELIIESAEAGKHIVVEKPMSLKLEDLEEIYNKVRDSGVNLSMYLSERFNSLYVTLKDYIRSGGIGKPVLFYAFRPHKLIPEQRPKWMFNKKRYGNIILDLAIHDIDYLLWVNKSKVTEIKAYMNNQRFTNLDFTDNCLISMKFSNGAKAVVTATWLTPEAAPYHGKVKLDAIGTLGEAYLMRNEKTIEVCTVSEPPHTLRIVETEKFLHNVVRSIIEGRKPLVDLEASVEANRICLLASLSAESGRSLRFED